MENKAKNQQSNNEKKEEWPNEKTYDVFISYRRASSTDDDQRHSTSLARSIALELVSEGFTVYFDCWDGKNEYLENIEKSKYFFVLLTSYSWENEGGEKFKQEIDKIKKGIEEGRISKYNVWWIDIDKSASKKANIVLKEIEKAKEELKEAQEKLKKEEKKEIKKAREKKVKKAEEKLKKIEGGQYSAFTEFKSIQNKYNIDDINTKKDSLIKDFIDEPKNGNGRVIRKANRLSFKELKALHENNKRSQRSKNVLITMCCILAVAIVAVALKNKYKEEYSNLKKEYEEECIIFAGGGTVQKYIDSLLKDKEFSITNYTPNPGSKYIHIPSTIAWHLLWDDVFTEKGRQYCPIVLSTGKIDTINVNSANLDLPTTKKRIAEYKLDSIPLMVQVYNKNKDHKMVYGTITLDALKDSLLTAKGRFDEYEIWTTTEKSGTYLEYKRLINSISNFDLDTIVNKQGKDEPRRLDFNPETSVINNTKTTIILANKQYFYTKDKANHSELTLVSDNNKTLYIPLYVYTIAEVKDDRSPLKLLPEAAIFLDTIGCDTSAQAFRDGKIIFRWNPKNRH